MTVYISSLNGSLCYLEPLYEKLEGRSYGHLGFGYVEYFKDLDTWAAYTLADGWRFWYSITEE